MLIAVNLDVLFCLQNVFASIRYCLGLNITQWLTFVLWYYINKECKNEMPLDKRKRTVLSLYTQKMSNACLKNKDKRFEIVLFV